MGLVRKMTRREAIKKRLAEATPGEWKFPYAGAMYSVEANKLIFPGPCDEQDATLIAHAPDDMRLLLEVVEVASNLTTDYGWKFKHNIPPKRYETLLEVLAKLEDEE